MAARGDAQPHGAARAREDRDIGKPAAERAQVRDIFEGFGLSAGEAALVTDSLAQHPNKWADFTMRFELGLQQPDPARAWHSALTIAGATIVGGLVPLFPYFLQSNARSALPFSVGVTLLALGVSSWIKGRCTGTGAAKSALQTTVVGGLAACAAFGIARLIGVGG